MEGVHFVSTGQTVKHFCVLSECEFKLHKIDVRDWQAGRSSFKSPPGNFAGSRRLSCEASVLKDFSLRSQGY